MSRRRRGERNKEPSSGTTAPLERASSPPQYSSASQNYPRAGKPEPSRFLKAKSSRPFTLK